MYQFLKQIIHVPSISGYEKPVADRIATLIAPYTDEYHTDALGNLIAIKRGSGENKKKIMLCAHMDEIGFLVTFIEENGYLRVAPIGGIDFVAGTCSPVIVGKGARGVLVPEDGLTKKEDYKAGKFYVDIGASGRKDAEKRVKIGDIAVIEPSLSRLAERRVSGRPLDDRIGCAILLDIAKRLENNRDDVYFVFSVQEEVGCRGAKTAAYAISPDSALVFDVTGTGDTLGAKPMAVKLGGGAAIKIKDSSVICDPVMVGKLTELAKKNRIAYQHEILTFGGTDTSSIQTSGFGCAAGALSIPSRYIHSAVEVVDMKDAEACRDLALAYIAEA